MAFTYSAGGIASLVSTNLNVSYTMLSESLRRLSSGLRVQTAADDGAAMAMSQLMRADIATFNQATRNAQDAVSLLQTAEASLDEIDEQLQSMKELAEQAATGTYTDAQRLIMHSEFQLMAAEIDRLAATTSYNGIKLLDGSLSSSAVWSSAGGWTEPNGGLRVQVDNGNVRAEDYYYITIADVSTTALFSTTDIAVSTQAAAAAALSVINTAIIGKDNARSWVGALQNRLEGTIDSLEARVDALTASESNITDADIATEMTNYLEALILAQAAIAMHAQANLLPQLALKLLDVG
ncbi:MAG: flagellin [Candidatus Cloacimonetes bacterium]|nr:flagellin [Candidatus Cloacimonadota bacterium]